MKFLLLTTFAAMFCCVSAGKTQRLLAALMANGALGNGVNPALVAAGLTPPLVVGGGAGLAGQPQMAQFAPGPFAVQGPVPNMYPIPAYQYPMMGVPQMAPMAPMAPMVPMAPMAPMNVAQQPAVGAAGGAMPQQLAPQPGPLPRFRRQLMTKQNALKSTVDTQVPVPTDATATTGCQELDRHQDN